MATAPTTGKKPAKAAAAATDASPIVVELGKHKRKLVKRLRDGRGKLVDRVIDVIDELRRAGTLAEGADPVVLVVRQKPKARRGGGLLRSFSR